MKEHRAEFQEYDIVMAKQQSAGKGRRGNIWISTEGMAMFTFLVKQKADLPEKEYMKLPLLAGLATIRALGKIEKANYALKWTNDIYLEGKKLGGILVERREEDFFIGIGLNLNNSIPSEIKHIAISLQEIKERVYDLEESIRNIVGEFQSLWAEFLAGKWIGLLEEMNRIHYWKDKFVVLRAGNVYVRGKVLRIDEEGEIELETEQGIKSFGMGELIRERIIVPVRAKVEDLARIYILKESSYDVIASLEEDFSEVWEEKLAKLFVKVERELSLDEVAKKYQASIFKREEPIFPLQNYDEESLREIAKQFFESGESQMKKI